AYIYIYIYIYKELERKFRSWGGKRTRIREISSWGRRPIWEWKRGTESVISTTSFVGETRPRRTPLTAEALCLRAWRTSFMYAF
ncbi:hypothetical protein TorRG33x02_178990, partial [Trema orientale]